MLLFVLLGLGIVCFGIIMIAKPLQFSIGVAMFSQKPWFHTFEILSRLTFGILFLVFSETTAFPTAAKVIGGLLCFVSLSLVVIGSKRHKQFALQTARIGKAFRLLGVIAVLLGSSLIYCGTI